MPLHHIKNGVFGLTGHCCAFEQDVDGFVNRLPRKPHDSALIEVMKAVVGEIKDVSTTTAKMFRVQKRAIHDALVFLCEHHTDHSKVEIDMSALDWLKGEEGSIDCHVLETEEIITAEDADANLEDIGPAPLQCQHTGDNISCFGHIDDRGPSVISKGDANISAAISETLKKSSLKDDVVIDWPTVSDAAVDEFSDVRLFVNAFPWLFPGGMGDPKDHPSGRQSLANWGRHMLLYEDGRFARDKLFVFFALNHIVDSIAPVDH